MNITITENTPAPQPPPPRTFNLTLNNLSHDDLNMLWGAIINFNHPAFKEFEEKISNAIKGVRRFTHVNCFEDNTDYLEWDGNCMWIVSKNGSRCLTIAYNLTYAGEYVKLGIWKEI